MSKKRDLWIDALRGLGLVLVILAHVRAPELISQLRIFDVPLMVFVSGLSFAGLKTIDNPINFLFKRIKRLVIPVWSFLILFFLGTSLFMYFPFSTIIRSFLLIDGIGYVWIIRVFILISIITPFLIWLNSKIKKNNHFYLLWVISFIIYHLFLLIKIPGGSLILYPTIGYSLVFILGLRIKTMEVKEIFKIVRYLFYLLIIAFSIEYIVSGSIHGFKIFKYPPTGVYVIYGVLCSSLLWSMNSFIHITSGRIVKLINVLSAGSMWIYLWHIPLLYLGDKFIGEDELWWLRYLFILVISTFIYIIQQHIISYINDKYPINKQLTSYFR